MQIDCAKPHILVWTKEESLSGMISSLLGDGGFQTLHASDQGEMFRFLEEYLPPMVVLDADLPKIMGYDVYELIKRIDRFKDVGIIVVSSTSRTGLSDTGQVEYVERGDVQDILLSKIRTFIPGESDDASFSPEREIHEEVRRFAGIIVSDIVLYNQEKAERGAREGTFRELLKKEIEEGRRFYSHRMPEEVLASTNYYDEAIDAYVRKLSMK